MSESAPRGGISGLAAANRVRELAPEVAVTVFEAEAEPGGVLQTDRRDRSLRSWVRPSIVINAI